MASIMSRDVILILAFFCQTVNFQKNVCQGVIAIYVFLLFFALFFVVVEKANLETHPVFFFKSNFKNWLQFIIHQVPNDLTI